MPVNSVTATFTTSSGSESAVVLAVAEVAVVSPSCWPWKTQMPSEAHALCPRSRRPPELVRSAWTTWLIVAALAPNETANWLMSTGAYNNGQFWLISDKTRVSSSLARLVLLSLMLATSYHSRRDDTWLRSKRKFSNVSSKALNLAMQVLPVVLLHLLESGAPEQRSSSAQSSTGL
ncbi:hypothetical protein PF001_g14638 [Phytophthora fragariae]|uniref:Uncharacterized protein n=1 Tax=Phytophthora fragariae TaxID=53985 RepID=A0A6A4D471_9STRA|nr:hypothetical protein PF001_g14638 [Phytophthora fragariae]